MGGEAIGEHSMERKRHENLHIFAPGRRQRLPVGIVGRGGAVNID